MIRVKIDDRQIMDFVKKSPARSRWAMSEALKMTGGHFRKKLRAFIESGGENWPPGHPLLSRGRTPLFNMGALVRFKYGKFQGNQRVQVGFFGDIAKIIKKVSYGRKIRVTEGLRKYFIRRNVFLKKTTQTLTVPVRLIFEPFLRREERNMLAYMEKKFFEKFFSKEKSNIAY